MDVRGSVAIVTGASSGIGEATARAGATVVLAARRADELQRLAAEIEREGGRALAVPTDMTSRQAIERLVGVTVETFGRIDIVVNNAGIGGGGSILDDSDELMERVVSVNLLAPARLVQAALPHMRRQSQNGEQGHGQGRERGVIVNVGSVAGDVATSGMYAASKFGLRGLNDVLRRELRPYHIAVVLMRARLHPHSNDQGRARAHARTRGRGPRDPEGHPGAAPPHHRALALRVSEPVCPRVPRTGRPRAGQPGDATPLP